MKREIGGISSIQTQVGRMNGIYGKLKIAAMQQQITIRRALREAVLLWMHKNEFGSTPELYEVAQTNMDDVLRKVRALKDADNIEELEASIDHILETY